MSEEHSKLNQTAEAKNEADETAAQGDDVQSSLPLYLRNKSEGDRGDAQDEKDESAE